MTKDKLIKKWLHDDLNAKEMEAFKALDDYDALMKLSKGLTYFQAPEFDEASVFKSISANIPQEKAPKKHWLFSALKIAALIAVAFSIYYYTSSLNTNISTRTAEKTTIKLPDNSQVTLNALSNITFNKKNWHNTRDLTLTGEAYFNVEKGSKFEVKTKAGNVTVLGTKFLVENRDNLFEVICYEGSVKVSVKNKNTVLKPGDQFLILNGKLTAKEKENTTEPYWLQDKSVFKSMPYRFVLKEFERQYDVAFNIKNINTETLFTGQFTHHNLDHALKAITLPLNINYTTKNGLITLHEK